MKFKPNSFLPSIFYILALLLLSYCSKNKNALSAQTIIDEVQLPKKINETSGLEFFNQHFLTHNDSGGSPTLYAFNQRGEILQEYNIADAENNDWEDITKDENFIYISDSGNNRGNRKNLNILIVNPDNYFEKVGSIAFRYRDQENFDKKKRHPYDAEALIATPKALVLFSKNRSTETTELYSIPKMSGNYILSPLKSFDLQSLITGGDYNHTLQMAALVGYNFGGEQFLYTLSGFNLESMDQVQVQKYRLPLDGKQIEAIKIIDQNTFWITSEDKGIGYPILYKIKI